jgi:pimeloyl-ACP methyl ester carboxylesterase
VSTNDSESGALVISGGSTVVVATAELRRQAMELGDLAGALSEVRRLVVSIKGRHGGAWLIAVDAPTSAQHADHAVNAALELITQGIEEAEHVAHMVRHAMWNYGMTEALNTQLLKRLEAQLGYGIGQIAPIVALLALPVLGTAAATVLLIGAVNGKSPGDVVGELGQWAREHAGVLTDPLAVSLVRGAMHSADDVLGGLLRIPETVVDTLGEYGANLTDLGTTAAVVVGLGRTVGLLMESPVVVTQASTASTTPPTTLAGRSARIPEPGADEGEQIRIDRYSTPGQPDRFEVYIAGTVDLGIVSGTEPWDMTSNINAIAGMSAASVAAVQEAMAQAGITASSPVVITGHSQGGLVAATIAESSKYNVQALVTFGAPIGAIEIPSNVPALSVRHTDDVVHALNGHDVSIGPVVVEREVYANVPVPTDQIFPAHRLSHYQETARLIDASDDTQVRRVLAVLDSFAEGSRPGETTVESTTYLARRED